MLFVPDGFVRQHAVGSCRFVVITVVLSDQVEGCQALCCQLVNLLVLDIVVAVAVGQGYPAVLGCCGQSEVLDCVRVRTLHGLGTTLPPVEDSVNHEGGGEAGDAGKRIP